MLNITSGPESAPPQIQVNIAKSKKRLNKRKKKNRYDKFSSSFYNKVQKSFIKISKTNKKKYVLLDNSKDSHDVEKIIFKKFIKRLYR